MGLCSRSQGELPPHPHSQAKKGKETKIRENLMKNEKGRQDERLRAIIECVDFDWEWVDAVILFLFMEAWKTTCRPSFTGRGLWTKSSAMKSTTVAATPAGFA